MCDSRRAVARWWGKVQLVVSACLVSLVRQSACLACSRLWRPAHAALASSPALAAPGLHAAAVPPTCSCSQACMCSAAHAARPQAMARATRRWASGATSTRRAATWQPALRPWRAAPAEPAGTTGPTCSACGMCAWGLAWPCRPPQVPPTPTPSQQSQARGCMAMLCSALVCGPRVSHVGAAAAAAACASSVRTSARVLPGLLHSWYQV